MLIKFLAYIIFIFVKLLTFSYRFVFHNRNNPENCPNGTEGDSFVLAVWHQDLVGGILAHNDASYSCIVSQSKDGELVAIALRLLGHTAVRGSSTRGGKNALMNMVQSLKDGNRGAITVDGPKGPPKIPKKGIFELSRSTGKPIVPVGIYAESCWMLKKSWDQMIIPKPFTKIHLRYGNPVLVDRDLDETSLKYFTDKLTNEINESEKTIKQGLGIHD